MWRSSFRHGWKLAGLGIVLGWMILAPQMHAPVANAARPVPTPSGPSAPVRANTNWSIFLPFVRGGVPAAMPMLVGTYPVDQYLGDQTVVDNYLLGLDSWAGLSRAADKGHSLAGTFIDLRDPNPSWNIPHILNTTWNSGYVAFVNIMANGLSATAIANGSYDAAIRTWADNYLAWTAQGSNRRAFLALLPEMNWHLSSWSYDPAGFIAAYRHIQSVFEGRGVTRDKAWWVFAPNGYSSPPYYVEDYYPGDAYVDVVGFSSYNQSYATAWMSPNQVFGPYIQEIRSSVTFVKPIFIAQTATCSTGGDKDQWLRDAYSYLYQQGIRGVMYFNGNKECDWAVYRPDQGTYSQGYKDAVAGAVTRYVAPASLAALTLPP